MNVSDALACLGASRVVWIDDEFNESEPDLAEMLIQHVDVAIQCELGSIGDAIQSYHEFPDGAVERISEELRRVPALKEALQAEFLKKLAEREAQPSELSKSAIDRVRDLLRIQKEDCWSFDKADSGLPGICGPGGDDKVLYIVDLKDEVTNDPERGLDVLLQLDKLKSRGTAFILSREADTDQEKDKEDHLRRRLKERAGQDALNIPTCVIAKERLLDHDDVDLVQKALQLAIKRAGLRRSIHEALWAAEKRLHDSFIAAADKLTRITPEKLESFVVEKAYKEGLSELHVVERALTAHMSRDIRALFGATPALISSAERMRSLRAIELDERDTQPDENLESFRRAEIWEEPELINKALSPITGGDVFEIFSRDQPDCDRSLRFLLLGQACDISLRWDGKRDQDVAILVPLRTVSTPNKSDGTAKKPRLPFMLDGVLYACDFRGATSVRLGILDLASFRKDGHVRFDQGQTLDPGLLPGQSAIYHARIKPFASLLNAAKPSPQTADAAFKQQLTFDSSKAFASVNRGVLLDASAADKDGQPALPKRFTWKLTRCGRIRMPYAEAILENYLNVISRRAFDVDYIGGGEATAGVQQLTRDEVAQSPDGGGAAS